MERIDRAVWAVFIVALAVSAGVVGVVIADSQAPEAKPDCGQTVERGVLPRWARTGFSDPRPRIAHVIGRRGELAAILFGEPLSDPPSEQHSNKILWVARRTPPPGPLKLKASNGSRTINRVLEDGPGPSGVDLPAGCWRLEARWPGGEDELDLTYVKR